MGKRGRPTDVAPGKLMVPVMSDVIRGQQDGSLTISLTFNNALGEREGQSAFFVFQDGQIICKMLDDRRRIKTISVQKETPPTPDTVS